ncbi:hypothetical protein ABIF66_006423 [Bradyrhizobium japonicum]
MPTMSLNGAEIGVMSTALRAFCPPHEIEFVRTSKWCSANPPYEVRPSSTLRSTAIHVVFATASNLPDSLWSAASAVRLRPSRPVGQAVMMQPSPGRGRVSMRADIRPSRSGVFSKLPLC